MAAPCDLPGIFWKFSVAGQPDHWGCCMGDWIGLPWFTWSTVVTTWYLLLPHQSLPFIGSMILWSMNWSPKGWGYYDRGMEVGIGTKKLGTNEASLPWIPAPWDALGRMAPGVPAWAKTLTMPSARPPWKTTCQSPSAARTTASEAAVCARFQSTLWTREMECIIYRSICRYVACAHGYAHAYMRTCIHAYVHTCIHAYMHTCIHEMTRVYYVTTG